jgi:hypothetical protein
MTSSDPSQNNTSTDSPQPPSQPSPPPPNEAPPIPGGTYAVMDGADFGDLPVTKS